MPIDLSKYLVVGVSSRALFDLGREDEIFKRDGLRAYESYQRQHEDEVLKPGAGFPLVKAILQLNNTMPGQRKTEVVIMSRNSAQTSLRIFNSIKHYGLDIRRAALSGGAPLSPYLHAFSVDLFLSLYEDDVQTAVNAGVAAALLYDKPADPTEEEIDQIRIAFDGDAVLFSDDSEQIYQTRGLEEFIRNERENAQNPLLPGPFAKLLKTLSYIQSQHQDGPPPIRTALVTARSSPAHERVIRTLRAWDVHLDEAFFLGGMPKGEVLKAFRPHIYFDDQTVHCDHTSQFVPTGRVPYVTSRDGEDDAEVNVPQRRSSP